MDAKAETSESAAAAAAAAVTIAAVTASAPVTSTPSATAAVDKSTMTPDDAYWAEQPEAVQALRNMPEADRQNAAVKLAQAGNTIDVPIMVWGWDPLTTMVERQNYGYTWVPSALGSPVLVPPGLSFPGEPSYDAANPPAGSIKVTTDFAAGTNMKNVFIDPATLLASLSPAALATIPASVVASVTSKAPQQSPISS